MQEFRDIMWAVRIAGKCKERGGGSSSEVLSIGESRPGGAGELDQVGIQ